MEGLTEILKIAYIDDKAMVELHTNILGIKSTTHAFYLVSRFSGIKIYFDELNRAEQRFTDYAKEATMITGREVEILCTDSYQKIKKGGENYE